MKVDSRDLQKGRVRSRVGSVVASILGASVVLGAVSADAAILYSGTRVSDSGLTGNTIKEGNTSRNLAVGSDGAIYAVFGGTNGVRVAKSVDKGQSFGESVVVSSSATIEPEVTVASTGIVYVGWIESGTIKISRSLDSGKTFSTPVDAGAGASSVHLATDANMLYVVVRNGEKIFTSSDNGLTFTSVTLAGGPQVFGDVHVDQDSGDVIVQVDNPTVKYYVSTDRGATFSAMLTPTGGGSVMYSVGALSSGAAGRHLLIAGSGSGAVCIDIDSKASQALTFGNNMVFTARSLVADRYGNVVDGFVNSTAELQFHVSTDIGATFGTTQTVASVPLAADQYANVFIDQTNGNVLFLYAQSGEVFLNVYGNELPGYSPALNTSEVVFSVQLEDTTSTSRKVKLTNSGTGPLNLTDVSVIGDFEFAGPDCKGTLAPGASCELQVKFAPTDTGQRTGAIEIMTDAFSQPRVIKLSGVSVTTAAMPVFEPAPLSFGKAGLDSTNEVTAKLKNAGNLDLDVNGFVMNGPFEFTNSCPAKLAPGASCDVVLKFKPDALGDYTGSLSLDSNAPGAPAALEISGTGANVFKVTTAATTSGGTITPTKDAVEGEPAVLAVTPESTYKIASVTGCGGTLAGSTYTTAPVTAACSVSASFTPIDTTVPVTAKGKGGGGALGLLSLAGLVLPFLARIRRRFRVGLLAAVPAALASQAQAADFNHWYVGGDIGVSRTNVDSSDMTNRLVSQGYNVNATLDDRSETAWRAFGGWQFSKNFAAQLGYTDLGTFKTTYDGRAQDVLAFLEDANRSLPHSAQGAELALVANYPLAANFAVTAQVGAFFWSSEYKVFTSNGQSVKHDEDGVDVTFGAGLEYAFASRVAVNAGWSHYSVDGEKVNVVSLGAKYRLN